jgi:succinyl-CoA synthetase alpha subunit
VETLTDGAVLVQGITDGIACRLVRQMQGYGTPVVAGIAPGDPCVQTQNLGIPLFDLVEQAMDSVGGIQLSIILGSAHRVMDAALEAIEAGIRQLILTPQGVPPLDMVRLLRVAEQTDTLVVGSHSAGVMIPGATMLGTFPPHLYTPGSVGLISRSSTLGFEGAGLLTKAGLGQSLAVSVGGDPISGSSFAQWLQLLEEHEPTQLIVLLGELGGTAEEEAAQTIADQIDKPVVAYISGQTVSLSDYLGFASTTLDPGQREKGSAARKIEALKRVGVIMADRLDRIPELVLEILSRPKE